MKKYICLRGWQRNPTGAILEEWEYNKLPEEVKQRNFKEHIAEAIPEPVKKVEWKPRKSPSFTVDDVPETDT